MPVETWLVFLFTVTVLFISPGPTIFLVAGQALASGGRSSMWVVVGILLANVAGLGLSFLGVVAILASSGLAFNVLKWAGAGYLVYLGVQQWRHASKSVVAMDGAHLRSPHALLLRGFGVTIVNPKILIFYAAFLPQFIPPGEGDRVLQLAVLSFTFLVLSFLSCALYAMLAGKLRSLLSSERWLRTVNRCSGALLVGAAALTALMDRT